MPLGAPALGRTDNYSTVVAVHNTLDNSLAFFWNNDGDPTWTKSPPIAQLGPGTTFAAPALIRNNNEDTTLIAVQGPENSLNFYWNNDGDPNWQGPYEIAGKETTYSDPAICRTSNAVTIIAVQGPNNTLSAFYNNDGDPWWHSFGMPVVPQTQTPTPHSALAIASINEVVGDLVAMLFVGPNNLLNYAEGPADPAVGYQVQGGFAPLFAAYAPPAIVYNTSNNSLLVATQGSNNSLDYYWTADTVNPDWNPSEIASTGNIYSAPSIGRTDHNSTVVAALSANNGLYFCWNNDGDSTTPWKSHSFGGKTAFSAPALGRIAHEATIIVVRGPYNENELCFWWNNDGDPTWHGPYIIGAI